MDSETTTNPNSPKEGTTMKTYNVREEGQVVWTGEAESAEEALRLAYDGITDADCGNISRDELMEGAVAEENIQSYYADVQFDDPTRTRGTVSRVVLCTEDQAEKSLVLCPRGARVGDVVAVDDDGVAVVID